MIQRAPRRRSVIHLAIAACWLLVTSTAFTADVGTVEGQLRIPTHQAVQLDEPADKGPNYARYLLIIRSSDAAKEIARTAPDRTGSYRLSLPPGDYVLAVEQKGRTPPRSAPQKFTVTSGKTVRVDTAVLPDLRAVAPDRIQSD